MRNKKEFDMHFPALGEDPPPPKQQPKKQKKYDPADQDKHKKKAQQPRNFHSQAKYRQINQKLNQTSEKDRQFQEERAYRKRNPQ